MRPASAPNSPWLNTTQRPCNCFATLQGPSTLNCPPIMLALIIEPVFAAAGYSMIYLLGGGGLGGAVLIFIIAKLLRK